MNEGELKQLVADIKSAEMILLDKATTLNKLKNSLDITKTSMMNEIASEVDGNGKVKYSNQIKRDAIFLKATIDSKEYSSAETDITKEDYEISVLRIELQDLKYQFRIQEILSRI